MNRRLLWVFIPLLLLTACSSVDKISSLLIYRDVVQWRQPESLSSEIAGDVRVGQTVDPDCDGFSRIALLVVKQATTAPTRLRWHLQDAPGARNDVASGSIDLANAPERGYVTLEFDPIADSAEAGDYYFYVENPDAAPGQGVRVAYSVREYTHSRIIGQRYENGQPAEGDLTFMTYCTFIQAPREVLEEVLVRFRGDPVFIGGYFVLLVAIAVGIWWNSSLVEVFRRYCTGRQ